jgi:threonyl-tRNA synthetase
MSDIRIKLPDGSEKSLQAGATALDLAKNISEGLAKRVLVAKVNGSIQDLQDPLRDGDTVVLLDIKAPEAQDVICHSCEHVLAAAVVELFPKAQVTMGPKDHSEGFYYDFDIGRPFSDEDLVRIEEKMAALIKQGISFHKKWVTKSQAKDIFTKLGQTYKPEILDWIEGDAVTIYESGNFVDLCRGPHLPDAGFIKAFKLLGCSGSYWRADADREMLQRISGIAFAKKEDLEAYLFRIDEAKKRDHRKLGPKQGLFFVSEKFASWQDQNSVVTEARVLIYVPNNLSQKGKLNDVVEEVEGLLSDIKQALPSQSLSIKGMNILPASDADQEGAVCDVRIFAAPSDAKGRKDALSLIQKFNDKENSITVKCHFDAYAQEDIGPGLVMWLPHGGRIRSIIEDFSRRRHFEGGYEMVYSPHIAKSDLWRISGHLGFYQDSMFAPMNIDGNEYLLKPMNCPFHVLMYKWKPRSYRELPVRLAEFGTVYRYEMAGVLHGLMRVRGFTQDDAHIFCRWDQLDEELDKVLAFVINMLKAFGFVEFEVNISTRPQKYVGEETSWVRAEDSLKQAVSRTGLEFNIDEGGGAFYGPKIDIKLKDCLGRSWQCSTLQLDFNNPERFDLEYVNNQSEKVQPVMLHRALFGSIERFIGVLIEHYAGNFPAWLAPEQVRIITVSDRHNDYAEQLAHELKELGIRAIFQDSSDKLGAKIRNAQLDKVPLMVVVGDKEVSEQGGTLRLRSQEDKGFFKKADLVATIKDLCQEPH